MVVPRHRLSTVGRRAFAVHGPIVWNSLPDDLRAQQDYESLRQGLKPGFSLDSSVFSALETFVIISLYKSTFAIPYHTICNSLPEHLQLPSMSKGQFQCSLKPTSFSRPIDSENLTFSPDLT